MNQFLLVMMRYVTEHNSKHGAFIVFTCCSMLQNFKCDYVSPIAVLHMPCQNLELAG